MKASTVEALYREHNDQLTRALARRFHRGTLASGIEDAVADTWVIVARKPDSYLRPGTAFSWLYVVACRELLRQLDPHRDYEPIDEGRLVDPRANSDVLAVVINRDRVRELLDFITTEDTRKPREIQTARHQGDAVAGRQLASRARRRAVAARAIGVSYAELGEQTGTTYTSVNRATAEGLKLARTASRYQEN